MSSFNEIIQQSTLGKESSYKEHYDPTLLFTIPREVGRVSLSLTSKLPFSGYDIWNCYELSWLDNGGKPHVAIIEVVVDCCSPYLFESKSFKLYLNSFNQMRFENFIEIQSLITQDLSAAAQSAVKVNFILPKDFNNLNTQTFPGVSIDELAVDIFCYDLNPGLLQSDTTVVEEKIYSHLFKSNCPVTGQPDWASVYIHYRGQKISHESLLQYLISYRHHAEFHEACAERIFSDLQRHCNTEKLTVYLRFTRRGGIDINPYRSNWQAYNGCNQPLARQ